MSGCPTCRETEHECRSWDWSGHCAECGEKTLPDWERELLARQESHRSGCSDRTGWCAVGCSTSSRTTYLAAVVFDLHHVADPHLGRVDRDGAVRLRGLLPDLSDATVRILRRAEPEPDPAAVDLVLGALQNVPRAPTEISLADQARELVRRNVRVVPDA